MRNNDVYYQFSIGFCLNDINKVSLKKGTNFKEKVTGRGPTFLYQHKVLLREIRTCNRTSPFLLDKKLCLRLVFFSKVQVKRDERQDHEINFFGIHFSHEFLILIVLTCQGSTALLQNLNNCYLLLEKKISVLNVNSQVMH